MEENAYDKQTATVFSYDYARHTLQIPFGYQLLIRQIHGTPAHRQIARKRPRRRQPLPCILGTDHIIQLNKKVIIYG